MSQAEKIVEVLDSNSIKLFKEWSYSQRGDSWCKVLSDTQDVWCRYEVKNDSERITSFRISSFIMEYPCNIKFTNNDWDDIIFSKKKGDKYVDILGVDLPDSKYEIKKSLFSDSLFVDKDPFDELGQLNELVDQMKINKSQQIPFSTDYDKKDGTYKFYLTYKHVLVYLPPTKYSKEGLVKKWRGDIGNTKVVKTNWYLIKLKGQLDGG